MALNLSKEDLEWLRADLQNAEPYAEDDPILYTYDGKEMDFDRWRATMAKKFLEQYEREQREKQQ